MRIYRVSFARHPLPGEVLPPQAALVLDQRLFVADTLAQLEKFIVERTGEPLRIDLVALAGGSVLASHLPGAYDCRPCGSTPHDEKGAA